MKPNDGKTDRLPFLFGLYFSPIAFRLALGSWCKPNPPASKTGSQSLAVERTTTALNPMKPMTTKIWGSFSSGKR